MKIIALALNMMLHQPDSSKTYEAAVNFLKIQENCKLKPYGHTIGFGHTLTKSEYKKYKHGITYKQACLFFDQDYSKAIKIAKKLYPNLEYKKLLIAGMLIYNMGPKISNQNLGNDISHDNIHSLNKYVKSRGKVLKGLKKRRKLEIELWKAPDSLFLKLGHHESSKNRTSNINQRTF